MSSIEIRRVYDAENLPLSSYAFSPSPEPRDRLREAAERMGQPSDAVRLVAYDGDAAVAAGSGLPMTQHVRGRILPMLGVGAVAADPAARRQGHVRSLLDRLHGDFVGDGYAAAALWPFRPSFYAKFGYVGLPKARSIRLFPTGMGPLRDLELPGTVTLHRWDERAEEVADYLGRLQHIRHGFGLPGVQHLTDVREDAWVAFARRESQPVGMLIYCTGGIGAELEGRTLLYDDPEARTLLLRWLAAHDDQFASFDVSVPPGESPELWYTDAQYEERTRVATPTSTAPMARVLSMPGLAGIEVGEAIARVRVVDDPYIAGCWTLDGTGGTLVVAETDEDPRDDAAGSDGVRGYAARGDAGRDDAGRGDAITAHGLSALVFGVLRAEELPLRGYGRVSAPTARALNTLFPPAAPFLYSQF